MNQPLRILHLEDEADYADLVQTLLAQEVNVDVRTVSNRAQFEEALNRRDFDLILADYLLPDFDGHSALQLAHERCPDIPFVILSGTLAETAAIETLSKGATDYVLKALPERLVPAIKRALRESSERSARKRIELELRRNEQHFKTFTENSLDVLTVVNSAGTILYNSPSLGSVLGYEPKDVAGRCVFDLVHPEDLSAALDQFRVVSSTDEIAQRFEFRVRHKNGEWRCVEGVAQNRIGDAAIRGLVFTSRDVTQRKLAEQELRENEQQYRLIFDGNPKPMWVFDHETLAFLEVNDATVQHYGYSRDEFLKMKMPDLRPPSEDPTPAEYFHRLLDSKSQSKLGYAGVWSHMTKAGARIIVEVKWAPITFRGRNASLALVNDITERTRIEQRDAALSKLGQSLNATNQTIEAARIIMSVTNELFTWDVFTLNLYFAEKDQLIPVLNMDTDRDGRRFEVPVDTMTPTPGGLTRRAIAGGSQFILRQDPPEMDPDIIPVGDKTRPSASLMIVPIRNRTKVIGVLSIQSYKLRAYDDRDLQTLQTLADHCGGAIERIRAEQALRESEMRFRELFQGSPDAIFVEDLAGFVIDVNPAACSLHASTRDELIGRHFSELVPASARSLLEANFPRMVAGELKQVEGYSLTSDGRERPVEVRGNKISYAGKDALLLHIRDITERKQSEEALRSSEMLFHSVWENSVDGMRLTDEDGNIVAVNNAFCRMVNMHRSDLENQPFTVPYAPSENHERQIRRYKERFSARVVEKQVERTLTLKDGTSVILEDTSSFVERQGKAPLLLSLFRDVTAQRRLQEQLRQSQKMEAIGQLAGGVAHDFNNILTVIHGHASLIESSENTCPHTSRSAQQIVQAAERAAGLTRQLLTFGRRQVMQRRRLDVNGLVANLTKMLGRILGEDIALKLQYSKDPALVLADPGMIEQVLLNLAINSRDAMPKGGVLVLKISAQDMDPRELLEHPETEGGKFVCISVLDTGCGIASENLKRIFEPFFTTKPVGKGTGLGLATVYGIVNQHKGWIEVDSAPNQGAEFKVFLPYCQTNVDPVEETQVPLAVRGGRETILVVEDEAPVRELVCSLLIAQGYRILRAESGPKALEIWHKCKHEVDLLITDLVMPEQMNGRELAEQLLAERPELKVIFTSGYSIEVAGKDFAAATNPPFLQKPYQPHRLIKTVRDCLDAAPAPFRVLEKR
jgi:PAS domain S-box-containing protein